ncbi:MAG: hypothetical protein HY343_11755 [Lentisphaerae bacterium]|nr:hypothetical protein [Lentisphaerota bacterium]
MNPTSLEQGPFANFSLRDAAKRHFRSWNTALRVAGFDLIKIRMEMHRKRRQYPDKAAVVAAIESRRNKGLPLNRGSLKGKFENNALDRAAELYFGSWDKALRAAGIEPASVRLRK